MTRVVAAMIATSSGRCSTRLCFWSRKPAVLPETSAVVAAGGVSARIASTRVLGGFGQCRCRRGRSWRRRRWPVARANGVPRTTPSTASIRRWKRRQLGRARGAPSTVTVTASVTFARVVGFDVAVGFVGRACPAAPPRRWGRSASSTAAAPRRPAAAPSWPGRRRPGAASRRAPAGTSRRTRRRPPGRGGSRARRCGFPSSASSEGTTRIAITAESIADRGAGDGHRVEEALRQDHQRRHRRGDGEAGEERGAAGGEDGAAVGLARRAAAARSPRGIARPAAARSRPRARG